MMEQQEPAKKVRDPLLRIKHIAYCLSQTPLEGTKYEDLVAFAKFQLASMAKKLLKDPIWDLYTGEEILVEYYAHMFTLKPDILKDFELSIATGDILDFNSWADLQIKQNEDEKRAKLGDLEDKVTFSPNDVMGGGN